MITYEQIIVTPWGYDDVVTKCGEDVALWWGSLDAPLKESWRAVMVHAAKGNPLAIKLLEFAEIEYVKWRLKGDPDE